MCVVVVVLLKRCEKDAAFVYGGELVDSALRSRRARTQGFVSTLR